MPALSNGNTCWGNRKPFNLLSDYTGDSFPLGEVFEERRDFISSNSYYGFHRIPEPRQSVVESMVIDENDMSQVSNENDMSGFPCRKRPNTSEESLKLVKRFRQLDSSGGMPLTGDPGPSLPRFGLTSSVNNCNL